jgi:AraC family transcriptional regulator
MRFLHFHVSANYIPSQRSATQLLAAEGLNDLVLLRDPLAEQLARVLTEHGDTVDEQFARCIGQTLAMHLARLECPRTKINALPKWRLRRVEEYVKAHFDRCINLSDLANAAGLSRMHFCGTVPGSDGISSANISCIGASNTRSRCCRKAKKPLAEVALAVGFCTQAHFSTVFKRIMSETPARWRCASKNELPSVQSPPQRPPFGRQDLALCHAVELA